MAGKQQDDAQPKLLSGGNPQIPKADGDAPVVIGFGSMYRIASLRGGGEPVALQMGGVPVPEDTTDPNLRRLRNVVEEIAIASGVPVPKVYVLEHEAAINAFAAGYSTSDAVVAVTRGALDRLNRDELQGVIAHEFSHILNGDMRLNIRLVALLHGIVALSLIGRLLMESSRDSRRSGLLLIPAGALVFAVGSITFCGSLPVNGFDNDISRILDNVVRRFSR